MAMTIASTATMHIIKLDTKKLSIATNTSIFTQTNTTIFTPNRIVPFALHTRKQRRPENVQGDFFVDHTCIDCDTCRWMAPETFTQVDDMSAVYKQPSCEDERLKALQALLSCPTSSIHTEERACDIVEVQKTFPIAIDLNKIPSWGNPNWPGCLSLWVPLGKVICAASYFIVHPEGNIIVDCPRVTESLASNIEMMGGALYMFLTHKDDVADHAKWSKRLNCKRIIHVEEVTGSTANVEIKLEGTGPWSLGEDFTLHHTPGHTTGSVSLLYKPKKVLFTGDHLFNSETGLDISEKYNFYSVPIQLDNIRKLLELDFEWILPGHGRRASFKDVAEKNNALQTFLSSKSALC